MKSLVLKLTLTSYQKENISLFLQLLEKTLQSVSISRMGFPVKRKLYTVLQSPYVHKKSREQFEILRFKENIVLTFNYGDQLYDGFDSLETTLKSLGSNCNLLVKVTKIL